MNDANEAINKLLTGLRQVRTPSGMEARILRQLKARATTPAARWGRLAWLQSPRHLALLAAGAAMAALAAVALLAPPGRISPTGPAQPSKNVSAAAQPSNAPAQPGFAGFAASRSKPSSVHVVQAAAVTSHPNESDSLSDEDALAISEMLAPSKPAPPLALTPQEKLIIRFLRQRPREEQIAMLDPGIRAREAAQSEIEFHYFFDKLPLPSTLPDNNE